MRPGEEETPATNGQGLTGTETRLCWGEGGSGCAKGGEKGEGGE